MRSRAALLLAFGALLAGHATPTASALTRTWTVRAPGARPGDIVLMTIPAPVYAAIQGSFSRLHLEAQGLEVPYAVQSRPATLPAVRLPGSRPRSMGKAGVSRIDLPLLAPGPFTSVRLRTRPLPFQRKVQIVDRGETLAEGSWVCLPESSPSCVLEPSKARVAQLEVRSSKTRPARELQPSAFSKTSTAPNRAHAESD